MGRDAGAAYLYDVSTGKELFKLTAADGKARDNLGTSVDISGNVAVVTGHERSGAAYLFDVTTGEQLFKLATADGSLLRRAAISGDLAVAASAFDVYLFDVSTGQEILEFDYPGVLVSDVAIDGNTVVVGSAWQDGRTTSAFVFDIEGGRRIDEFVAPIAEGGHEARYNQVAIDGELAGVGLRRGVVMEEEGGSAFLFGMAAASLRGDFDADGSLSGSDVDILSEAIRSQSSDLLFDLNKDQVIDLVDHETWVVQIAESQFGDANLDKEVNFEDFLALSQGFDSPGGWSNGDFNGSGIVRFDDFLLLSANFGWAAISAAAVPEPNFGRLFAMAALCLLGIHGRRCKRNAPTEEGLVACDSKNVGRKSACGLTFPQGAPARSPASGGNVLTMNVNHLRSPS